MSTPLAHKLLWHSNDYDTINSGPLTYWIFFKTASQVALKILNPLLYTTLVTSLIRNFYESKFHIWNLKSENLTLITIVI